MEYLQQLLEARKAANRRHFKSVHMRQSNQVADFLGEFFLPRHHSRWLDLVMNAQLVFSDFDQFGEFAAFSTFQHLVESKKHCAPRQKLHPEPVDSLDLLPPVRLWVQLDVVRVHRTSGMELTLWTNKNCTNQMGNEPKGLCWILQSAHRMTSRSRQSLDWWYRSSLGSELTPTKFCWLSDSWRTQNPSNPTACSAVRIYVADTRPDASPWRFHVWTSLRGRSLHRSRQDLRKSWTSGQPCWWVFADRTSFFRRSYQWCRQSWLWSEQRREEISGTSRDLLGLKVLPSRIDTVVHQLSVHHWASSLTILLHEELRHLHSCTAQAPC